MVKLFLASLLFVSATACGLPSDCMLERTTNISASLTAVATNTAQRLSCNSNRRIMQVGHSISDGTTYDAVKFVGDGQRQSLVPTLFDLGVPVRCVGQYTNGNIIGCPYTDGLGGATPGTIYGILLGRVLTSLASPTSQDIILIGPMMKNGLMSAPDTTAFFLAAITNTAALAPQPKIFAVSEPIFNDGSNLTATNTAIEAAVTAARGMGYTQVQYLHIYDCMTTGDIGGDNLHPTTAGYIKLGTCMAQRMFPYL